MQNNNKNLVCWDDFSRVEFRVGTITSVDDFPEAHNPSYKLTLDFGPDIGVKRSSAQITDIYKKEDLIGKKVVAIVNFPPKQIGPFMSECLVTGFSRLDGTVVLCVPDQEIHNGAKLG